MGRAGDPLGKRALFWMPVGDGVGDAGPWPGERVPTAAGKRALYSVASSAGGTVEARGTFAVACSSCGSKRRIGLVELLRLQLPVAAWWPRRVFDRWMTCPACGRRTWMSVTLAR